MSIVRTLIARLRALRRHATADRDLDDELRAYLDARAERYERQGLSSAEARRAALLEFEGVEHVKEAVREIRVGSFVSGVLRDARHGLRILRRSPGYALVVIATIALGTGVNAAIFSVVSAVLWRPLPYPDADRIVAIEADMSARPSASVPSSVTLDLKAQSRLITNIAHAEGRDTSLQIDGVMERVAGARASDDLLPLLGATPLPLGRPLENARDADGIVVKGVVISHELWQRRFGGDTSVIGRHVTVNNFDAQIVGVMRPDFRVYLPVADHVEEHVDVWLPSPFAAGRLYRGSTFFGRLMAGVTVAQAQAECRGLAGDELRVSVRPLGDVVTEHAKPVLMALGAAVGFVLFIACINVGNLMLARAKARERELAVRRALGATRFRLIRQLFVEILVLAAFGAACGLLFARAGVGVLAWLRPIHLPRQSEIAIDGVILLWTAGVIVASSVFFGLLPALLSTRDALSPAALSGRAGSLTLRRRGWHRALVISEVALSIAPLVAAGLMIRTFTNLLQAPIGFDPSRVIAARIPLNLQAFPNVDQRSTFYRDVVTKLRELPGVEAAGVGGPLPLAPAQVTQRYWRSENNDSMSSLGMQQSIMPGYLHVMGIPLRAGRDISDDDIARERRVAIVDERLATLLWAGDAIGRQLGIGQSKKPLEVIGVAGNIRARTLRELDVPMVYVPSHIYEIEQTVVVKSRDPISAVAPEIKKTVESLSPGRPVFDIRPMEQIVESSIDDTRFTMLVLSAFAVAALVLAGVGLYGTLAYLLAQRTQEFGVRLALGASAAGILRLVIRDGCFLTGSGAAIGLVAAFGVTRMLRGMLYGVTPLDGGTILGVAALVAVVAMIAVGRPAWRASRVDAATALRAD